MIKEHCFSECICEAAYCDVKPAYFIELNDFQFSLPKFNEFEHIYVD